jgi:hypothetical protein
MIIGSSPRLHCFIVLSVQSYMLFFGYFCFSFSLVWVVFFVLICHIMILCRSCTNLACQLLAFNEILIFQKK